MSPEGCAGGPNSSEEDDVVRVMGRGHFPSMEDFPASQREREGNWRIV